MNTVCVVRGVEPNRIFTYEHNSCHYQLHKVTKHNARQVELILKKCNLLTGGDRVFPEPTEWCHYFDYSYLVIYATFSVATIVCKKVSNELIVEAIAVLDNFRNIGLSKFMLSSVLNSLRNDIHFVSARMEDGCRDIHHLYTSCGFKSGKEGILTKENITTDQPTQ